MKSGKTCGTAEDFGCNLDPASPAYGYYEDLYTETDIHIYMN